MDRWGVSPRGYPQRSRRLVWTHSLAASGELLQRQEAWQSGGAGSSQQRSSGLDPLLFWTTWAWTCQGAHYPPPTGVHSSLRASPAEELEEGPRVGVLPLNLCDLGQVPAPTPPASLLQFSSVQFSPQSCPLCDPMDCSMPGRPVHRQLPELAQAHVH